MPAIRTAPLLSLIGGALSVLCLAYSQIPASVGYLLTAVLAGVLCVAGGAYLLRRKSEWGWIIILIPVFTHSVVGDNYYPYRSTGLTQQFVVYAQWLAVTTLTATLIFACVVVIWQRGKR